MKQKTIGEIRVGQWLLVGHFPVKSTNTTFRICRRFGNRRNTMSDKECTAQVSVINHLFGHTYTIQYKCLCNRYFEERVKVSTLFWVKTKQEVMMDSIRK